MAISALATVCQSEFKTLVSYGNDFLLLAVFAAAIATVLSAVERIVSVWRTPSARLNEDDSTAATVIDAIKNLIVALGQAPGWIALLSAAALLLWIAPSRYGGTCAIPQSTVR